MVLNIFNSLYSPLALYENVSAGYWEL